MKSYIIKLLHKTSGKVSNIIYNVIQSDAKYNPYTDKFEVPLAQLHSSYFDNKSNPQSGIIENTPIHWEVICGNLTFWLE